MRKKSIVASALILTLAGIITRLMGFVYRIYMSNAIGAEGMGLYQLITPIYTLAWSISCSGFTTTISKLIAQERAKKEYGNMGRILKQCIVITSGIGFLLTLVFYFLGDYLAIHIIKDPRTALSLRLLAFSFPFMAAGSCIRGYFFGLQESTIPAISQVFEQSIRMIVVFLLAGTLMPMGLEYACAAAIIGVVIGEVLSFLYVLFAYKRFKTKNILIKKPSLGSSQSLFLILGMAFPLTLNRVTGSLLMAFENILIPQRLQLYGNSLQESMAQYGKITGMAMPLVFFPTAILVALSISLVPAVAEATAVKNKNRINETISKSLLFTSVVGIGAAGLFVVFSKELGMIIYRQNIGEMLFFLGFMCPFIYLQVVLSGILNGLGEQVFIFRNSLISSFINIGFIYYMLPKYGINGFILGWFTSLLVVCYLDLSKVRHVLTLDIRIGQWFLLPTLAISGASLTMHLVAKKWLFAYFGDVAGLLISIVCLGLMYMFFVVMSGCISMKEMGTLFRKPKK